MKTVLLLILLLNSSFASERLYMLSDTYQEGLREDIKLIWGDDAFKKNPGTSVIDETTKDEEEPILSAIMYDPTNPLAIINGNPVGIGAKINDREITEIGRDYVLLGKEGSTVELYLNSDKKKRRRRQ